MNRKNWRIVGRFALLILIQLLVLNNVPLNAYMPRLYLYLLAILMLPTDMKRIPMLLTAFGTGLLMDIMDTSPLGFQALACSIVAMMRILFVDRILTRGESAVISTPSIYSVSLQYFISYLLSIWCSSPLVSLASASLEATSWPPSPAPSPPSCWRCSISSSSSRKKPYESYR